MGDRWIIADTNPPADAPATWLGTNGWGDTVAEAGTFGTRAEVEARFARLNPTARMRCRMRLVTSSGLLGSYEDEARARTAEVRP